MRPTWRLAQASCNPGALSAFPTTLCVPEGAKPIAILCVGHVESFYSKPMLELEGWTSRKALEDMVYENAWRAKQRDPECREDGARGERQLREFVAICAVNFYFLEGKNSMYTNFIRLSFALVTMAGCSLAYAHPGHGNGYLAGMAHPLIGLDHLVAMVAVGLWAFQIGGRAVWAVPASFVVLMSLGAGMGMAGMTLPFVESGIATSILVLGLLIAFSIKAGPGLGGVIVGFFALFHGVAHGTEMPALAAPWQYALGFVTATSALHALGLGFGRSLSKQRQWLRVLGFLVAAAGGFMILLAR